jgi:hypothetical protein
MKIIFPLTFLQKDLKEFNKIKYHKIWQKKKDFLLKEKRPLKAPNRLKSLKLA